MGQFYIAVKLLLSLYLLTACAAQPAQPKPATNGADVAADILLEILQ